MSDSQLPAIPPIDPLAALLQGYETLSESEPQEAYLRLKAGNVVAVNRAEMGVKDTVLLFLSRFGVGPYRLEKIAAKVAQLDVTKANPNALVSVQASLISKIAHHNSKWYKTRIDTNELTTTFTANIQRATDVAALKKIDTSLALLSSPDPQLAQVKQAIKQKLDELETQQRPTTSTSESVGPHTRNEKTEEEQNTKIPGKPTIEQKTAPDSEENTLLEPHKQTDIEGTETTESHETPDADDQFHFLEGLIDEASDMETLDAYKETIEENPKLSKYAHDLLRHIEDKQFEVKNSQQDLRKILEEVYEADHKKLKSIAESHSLEESSDDMPAIVNLKFIIRDAIEQRKSHLEYVVGESEQLQHAGFGIRNAGNSCYLNALLQAFYYSGIMDNCFNDEELDSMLPEMKEAAQKRIRIAEEALQHAREHNNPLEGPEEELKKAQIALDDVENNLQQSRDGSSLLREKIQDIFTRLKNGRIDDIQNFREYLISNVISFFGRYTQEDACELCIYLLEAMLARKVTYTHTYEGIKKIDEGRVINYPVTGDASSTNDLLQSGQYQFNKESLPEVLPITLARFNWAVERQAVSKNKKSIVPDLEILVPVEDSSQVKYALQAVVVHSGSTPHFGHYYTYVPRQDGRWTEYNDSNVYVPELKRATDDICHNGYLYFYRRVPN